MAAGTHTGHLGAVYDATDPKDVAALYDGWAVSYDDEMAKAGYRHPSIGLALLARHAPRGTGPVLDAGCGTGLLGDWLRILGFDPIEGLDLSKGMLDVARAKGCYSRLHNLALGGPLPFDDGAYAAVISTGVFTTGHVGQEALPELVRITSHGGPIVLTVKTTLWTGGFESALRSTPGLKLIEVTEPYVSMPGEAGTIPSLAVVAVRS